MLQDTSRPTRRPVSVRAQLILQNLLVLGFVSVIALAGYLNFGALQARFQSSMEQSRRISDLALRVQREFLLARRNEADFLNNWRVIGSGAATVRYVPANRSHLSQARAYLDQMEDLIQGSSDPSIRALTGDIDALRPLLSTYQAAFENAVSGVGMRGSVGGLESEVLEAWRELEAAAVPLPDREYARLVLLIRIAEQAYFNTNRQEYLDEVQLLVNRFDDRLAASTPADLTTETGTLSADELSQNLEAYYTLFTQLVALDQGIDIYTAVFQEVTQDIELTAERVAQRAEAGMARSVQQLEQAGQQSGLGLAVTGVLALCLGVGLAVLSARTITHPLSQLSQAAEQMQQGNLGQAVRVRGGAELVALARAFNAMAERLRRMLVGLEQQVADRTRALERRAVQLQAAAEVARDATAARDPHDLLTRAVNLIHDRFGFYHAGIFLVDAQGEYAVLRAATGEAGQAMLERSHRLKVGERGIVGYVTGSGRPRIALDVGADAVHFQNPLLPETRSELALPLRVADRVIGALDVQSQQVSAFDDEDVAVLQTMADQLAVAIQNLDLLTDMQRAMQELEAAYGRYTQETWSASAGEDQPRGYRYRQLEVEPAPEPNPEARRALLKGDAVSTAVAVQTVEGEEKEVGALAVPIRLRDQVIGVLNLRFEDEAIPGEVASTAGVVADRLGVFLDSVRLYEEAQQRASELTTLNRVTQMASSVLDLRVALQGVAHEMVQLFGARNSGIALLDRDHKKATVIADYSSAPDLPSAAGIELPVEGNPSTEEVIRTRRPLLITDAQHNPLTAPIHEIMRARRTECIMIVPLVSRGEVIGTIGVDSDRPGHVFTESELRLAETIAGQVAGAIENARLFEDAQQRASREQLIGSVAARVRASLDVDQVLRTATRELGEALGVARLNVRLMPSDEGNGDGH